MADILTETRSDFLEAVLTGLSQMPKVIPARYLYDRRGSELFEQITCLPEYYPTRTEIGLLKAHAHDIARLVGVGGAVIEFGSGSSVKTPLLTDAVDASVYVPIDISRDFLREAARSFARAHPTMTVAPLAGDFTRPLALPPAVEGQRKLGFFPGSTIGNLTHSAAVDMLRSMAETLGEGAFMVIGMDCRKNPRIFEAAYDDAAGVTAAFNLNILKRLNSELDGSIPVDAFEHRAVWHDGIGRVEMHLVAQRDMSFRVAGKLFAMGEGETIHTENSHKYTAEEARLLARTGGWNPLAMWVDEDGLFGLHVWQVAPRRMDP
ncbi:L-histidine N(alpha)-methyltransferase [Sphingobium subterraneum]|uniref:Dimethylhistidine N-methyltransferase n=1 Tax=Sphingobium subterraneum TaxID=627688 RepID=A0A841IUL4_9SPHN|nr:L-histidine N(alpha)-methyltransferase [Sphingobium subterraneum]MBB6122377.1 dimethylhistidine N-methyltransferase [Sphingobium subterraneum]